MSPVKILSITIGWQWQPHKWYYLSPERYPQLESVKEVEADWGLLIQITWNDPAKIIMLKILVTDKL